MRILYISSMFDDLAYKSIFTKEKKPMHAANKYHTLLCRGIAGNNVSVNAYSVLPVNRTNCGRLYIRVPSKKSDCLKLQYISSFNIPVIRNAQLFLKAFFKSLFSPADTVVLYDVLVVSASFGAVLGAKLSRKKTVGIVTDLPKFQPISKNKRMLRINDKLINMADGYIFLTKQMNDEINSKNKPFIVIEGSVDSRMLTLTHKRIDPSNKIVLYAGLLERIYGIDKLCRAFLSCAKPDEKLHIYGDGDYTPELVDITKKHKNIIYHGNRLNDEVIKAELEAALLVNPRPSSGEYTKFSFPSKTLEYMVSGAPVLTAKLPGIPGEYDDYLYYFNDDVKNGLETALRSVLDKSEKELLEMGARAKSFALQNKNNIIQGKRIIDFCSRLGAK